MASLATECLAAVTGIFPSHSRPSENDFLAAGGMLEQWSGRLRRWFREAAKEEYEPREFEYPEPPETEVLEKKLTKPMSEQDKIEVLGNFRDVEDGAQYIDFVTAARDFVYARWPKIPTGEIEANVYPPSAEEIADIWQTLRIIDGPDTLLDELEAQSLITAMVDDFRAVYPAIAAELDRIIDEMLIEIVAAKKQLTWQQDDLIRTLRGIPLDAAIKLVEGEPKQKQGGGNVPA